MAKKGSEYRLPGLTPTFEEDFQKKFGQGKRDLDDDDMPELIPDDEKFDVMDVEQHAKKRKKVHACFMFLCMIYHVLTMRCPVL